MYRSYRKTIAPCKDCSDRCVGCHATCNKYIEWKTREQERKTATEELNKTQREITDLLISGKLRELKKKNKTYRSL